MGKRALRLRTVDTVLGDLAARIVTVPQTLEGEEVAGGDI